MMDKSRTEPTWRKLTLKALRMGGAPPLMTLILVCYSLLLIGRSYAEETPAPGPVQDTGVSRVSFPPLSIYERSYISETEDVDPVHLLNPSQVCADVLRVNEIQMLAAHNSYHDAPPDDISGHMLFLVGLSASADDRSLQRLSRRLNLRYPSMEELTQSRGVIAIEIDVWKDTDGGRFRYAAAPKLARGDGDTGAEKDTPGFKVLHMPDYDYSTVPDCSTLLGCLSTVLSAMEASQLPMVLFLEYKSENATEMLDGLAGEGTAEAINEYLASYEGRPDALTSGEGVSAEDWAAIQADVLSVIPRDRVIAPADIEVINGKVLWPTLKESRGRVILIADGKALYQVETGTIFHRAWRLNEVSVGDDLTDATVDRAVVAVYTQPGEPNDLLTQAVAQRRLTVALGGFMDAQPFNGETDAEPVDATVAAARDALAAWAQRGVSIIKTDFIVHQSAPAVFKGMDGALAVPAEDIPPVLFGSSAVVQCNEGTLPEEFRSGPCCVPPKVPIEDPGLTGDYPALHAEACSVRVSAVVLTALVLMVVVLGF